MPDKKERPRDDEKKEKSFTGSPEQQLPDLEAEDTPDRQEQHSKKETDSDKQKDS